MFSGNLLRQHVDKVLKSEEFLEFYRSLINRRRTLKELDTPQRLLTALARRGLPAWKQDKVLVSLLREYQNAPSSNMNCLLIEVFRSALAHIFSKLRSVRPGEGDLWADLTWALLNLLWEYPVSRYPRRVAAHVQFGVLRHLTESAESDARYVLHGVEANRPWHDEFDFDELLEGRFEHPNEILAGRAVRDPLDGDDFACMEALLRRFLDDKVISQRAFYVILATRVYGNSLQEYADSHSLTYQAAKRQRCRAEEAIREAALRKATELDVPFLDPECFYGKGGKPKRRSL